MYGALGEWRLFIIIASVVGLDAIIGFSALLAKSIKRPKQTEIILLGIAFVTAVIAIFWLRSHTFTEKLFIVHFIRPGNAGLQLAADKEYLARFELERGYRRIAAAIFAFSSVCSIVLAIYQKRRLTIWLPLSLLGSAGSLVWLLAWRKEKY